MMKNLTILAALLAALIAAAEATAYRTTTTITIEEEEGNPRGQSCQEQLQRQGQQLRQCGTYLRSQQRGGGGGPYGTASLRMFVGNPQRQEGLQECCETLENLEEQCRCEAVKQVVRQQQQEGEMRGQQMQEVVQRARHLPSTCNLGPRECQIRAVWF